MGSPKKVEGPQYPFLVKQGSLCNLTLDEFTIGKSINNLGELFKNVISAEECLIMQNPSSSSSSSSSPPIFHGNPNISGALAKQTIDDVWNDIACQEHANTMKSHLPPADMSTIGEITLEEYLIQTGALNAAGNQEGFVQNPVPLMAKVDQHMVREWQQQEVLLPMPVQAIVGSNFQVSENGFENKMMDLGYLEKQLKMTAPTQAVAKYSDSQTETGKMRVFTDERMAKTVERRQRRMIKNRESAARSRARKQAYTNQLQHNVLQLQTTNNRLRKRKEVNTLLNSISISAPRHQLRRTSSTEF
ncbi:hypothetical protein Pfo_021737 [Paulownia fortunei]|nr:hypothetical protein Pfo_021737 [Paulownia fortunei]